MISAKVYLWGTLIGAVVQETAASFPRFSYNSEFLSSGIEFAPLTMPLSHGIYSFPKLDFRTFHGLPGALSDSLPDKYGTKVLERYLADQGRNIRGIIFALDKSNIRLRNHQMCISGKTGDLSAEDLLNAGRRMNLSKQRCLAVIDNITAVISK